MKLASLALSASIALGIAAVAPLASAQTASPAETFRAQMVPAQSTNTVSRYLLGPEGHVRALQLGDGAIVWIHGRGEGDTLAQRVQVGQTIHVDGMVHSGSPTTTFMHATISDANGTVLVAPRALGAEGAEGHHRWNREAGAARDPAQMEAWHARMAAHLAALPQFGTEGTVTTVLAGPRGRIHGVLLSNNTTVMFSRGVSEQVAQQGIRVGETVHVSGRGGSFPLGSSVIAEQLTLGNGTVISAPITEVPAMREGGPVQE